MEHENNKPVEQVDVVLADENTVWPQDYDWQKYFARTVNNVEGNTTVEAAKLRGVVIKLAEAQELVAALAAERTRLLNTVAVLATENTKLAAGGSKEPRKIKAGERVLAAVGPDKGSRGTVQFVEPSYEKVWVLRDNTVNPVCYHPSNLTVLDEHNVVTTAE